MAERDYVTTKSGSMFKAKEEKDYSGDSNINKGLGKEGPADPDKPKASDYNGNLAAYAKAQKEYAAKKAGQRKALSEQ